MVESIVGILAAAGVTVSAGLTAAVLRLNKRSRQLQQALVALQKEVAAQHSQFLTDSHDPNSSLGGLRISLAISQDHSIPTLSLLLKDALSSRHADVSLVDPTQTAQVIERWRQNLPGDHPDVLVYGSVTCNGYSEFYYRVMLNYLTPYGVLNPTSEQPVHGNPQASLVVTIVSKLEKELNQAQRRYERSRAIQELRADVFQQQIDR